ncbi:hypothetical protein [Paraburkholderia silvatlantica]|uniref:Uncharacterized protein n=1 Tax=Paraburkholderia silvatlantica TaxID=321895 RepID=A0ABR6FZB9_9BURK|nr:hypothetical protein [Paraburkholderia silvatlantica]MBB2932723.1 hypothetical protein [Paraburkholderia silvatlantica]PVY21473.1 hypothetical protein C7411_13648 [Paraburkholderia silvatlantica]PXW26070.1 hypothetical protein C7413_13748 [Paraburkholderia silvatlantica]
MEKGTYVLSGSLPVHDDLETEQIDRIKRHLKGFATVYFAHDQTAHTVSLHVSGTMLRDDARIIERRIEKFAEENGTAGAILLSEWNGLSDWLMVGLNWHVQCLLKLDAVQEQFARLVERELDFVVRLEPHSGNNDGRGQPLLCVSMTR